MIAEYKKVFDENKELFFKLYSYVCEDSEKHVSAILDKNPNFAHVPVYGGVLSSANLLHIAASDGAEKVCVLLINLGLDINNIDEYYLTPLVEAATYGKLSLVQTLVNKGAWVDGDSRAVETPLISASREGHHDIVEYLIESGADINRLQTKWNQTALDVAISYQMINDTRRTIGLLKSHGAISVHDKTNLIAELQNSALSSILRNASWVSPLMVSNNSVNVGMATFSGDKKHKLLFTASVSNELHQKEFMMYVPFDWPIHQQLVRENTNVSFPVQILLELAEFTLEGGNLTEGFIIGKEDTRWMKLSWPGKIDCLILINYASKSELGHNKTCGETDALFLLAPVKFPKTGRYNSKKLNEFINKSKSSKLAKNALKYSHLNQDSKL